VIDDPSSFLKIHAFPVDSVKVEIKRGQNLTEEQLEEHYQENYLQDCTTGATSKLDKSKELCLQANQSMTLVDTNLTYLYDYD
jgi:hypothetical protein